ncbi:MAG: cupin domain-containing protein [Halanaerobiales bacterium]
MNKITLKEKYQLIDQYWDPKIIGNVNEMEVKLAKIKGNFEYHTHQDNDELFYVFKGELIMKYRDSEETIKAGEMVIVPKGIEHKPYAEEETQIMLFEAKDTLNTGDKKNKLTKENLERI